ncbi:lytic transglycosylase domain-containing protein [Aliarcobacter thereius]|uniref:Soluble lytic murein transglycosylase n=1 Tax=Aliarcobacter thereius LMG 24486 TaxID=1032240 RepID=A0A1C7WRX1_9BACT|nr:lytic transglycosylase domain-containing protein [Aliarcobacter thereius]OCL91123.1 Soluble lytic murein transglycosylase precursor [Aliarcobacter thereius]OCL96024.1 Soluble lytic murein transglycosylase precursor [Aliarcobacter thereius LMG 24486]QBF16004.1 soluble lytic murein transglycosylase [Aliarcobacter thereius LMG 24486]TLS94653.1 lytic transglycosylase domain-containing protein [Aliarcobacter thereius]
MFNKIKLFIVFTLFSSSFYLYANIKDVDFMQKEFKVTLSWLQDKPKSSERDFFIVEFLNYDSTTKEEADIAYELRRGSYNASLERVYLQKFPKEINKEEEFCKNASFDILLSQNSDCINLSLDSISKLFKLSRKELHLLISKLENGELRENLQIISSSSIHNELLKNPKKFLDFFFDLNNDLKLKYFNKSYKKEFLDKLVLEKDFDKFVRAIVFNNNFKTIQKSFHHLSQNNNLSASSSFLLGINEINLNNKRYANNFFNISNKKSFLRSQKDNALFWLYLTTNDKTYLEELGKSYDTNLYSLYAKELLNINYSNIIYSLDNLKKDKNRDYSIYDSFAWLNIARDIRTDFNEDKFNKYQDIFNNQHTKAHLAYILERFNNYKTQYFLTPYSDIIKKEGIFKEVLIYSIARQESRFIPSAISISGAQGLMQIMPFLSKDIARKLKEPYSIYEQFIPKVNLKYASFHLDYLIEQFNGNPLFIAYAYNGGAGYTKSQLKKGLFKDKNMFEPFLSMESISYEETREYGKRVLANFYIYNNHLNSKNKISLSTIFQNLKQHH